jgi:hypothetical protein
MPFVIIGEQLRNHEYYKIIAVIQKYFLRYQGDLEHKFDDPCPMAVAACFI